MAPGSLFERVVTVLEASLATVPGTQICPNVVVVDRDGITQQIDVLVLVPVGVNRTIRIGIECRDYATCVKKDAVHAFKSKCDDARIDKGVIVTRTGYQKGAIEKAKSYGIELLTLSELDESIIKSWIRMDVVSIRIKRCRLKQVELSAPGGPSDIAIDECIVIDKTWNETSSLREFATKLLNVDPPNINNYKDGDRHWRSLTFEPGTVSLKWNETEFPLLGIRIEIESFTEESVGPRVKSGRLAEAESGAARGDVVTFRVPIKNDEAFINFVRSANGNQVKVISEVPAEIGGENPIREARLRALLEPLQFTTRHDVRPSDLPEARDEQKGGGPRWRVINVSLKVSKESEGQAQGSLARVYLADKRTSIETHNLIVYLLKRAAPPDLDPNSTQRKRVVTTIELPEKTAFVATTRGFFPVQEIITDLEFRP